MKKQVTSYLLALSALLFQVLSLQAQYTNHWYFGSAAGFANTGLHLDFTNLTAGNPTVLSNIPMLTEEGSSSISDAAGNPLFYTDGITVWNASNNAVIGTGFGGGSSSTQSALVLPKPGFTNQWLVFTTGANGGGSGLSYFTVTQTGSAPNTFTAVAGVSLVAGGAAGEGQFIVGSTKPGVSYWVISRSVGTTGQVRAFEVSNTGVVNTTAVTSTLSGPSFTNTNYNSTIGTIKSNTCQNKLAFTYYNNDADIVDFDAATGQVVANTARRITGLGHSYGLEFSPNDDYLFLTGLDERTLYSYTIATSTLTTMGTSPDEAGQLQLAPDGKIYMAIRAVSANPGYLGVISNPNGASGYSATGLVVTNVVVGGNRGFCYRGLPSFPKSLVVSSLSVLPGDNGYCVNTDVNLSYLFGGAAASQTWTITPGTAGTNWAYQGATSSTSAAPIIRFLTPNTYTVSVDVLDECGRHYIKSMVLTITTPLTPSGTITCNNDHITMTANPADPNRNNYIWYTAAAPATTMYGVGSVVDWYNPDQASAPSSVWVEVGGSVSSTTVGTGSDGLPPSWLNGSSYVYSTRFNVISQRATLNSFQILPWAWPGACPATTTVSFTIQITNSGGTVVYSKPYSATITCGSMVTVPVAADLLQGTNYTLSLLSFTSNASSWQQIFNGFPATVAGVASTTGPSSNYTIIGNLNYTGYTFTTTSTCSNRVQINRSCTLPVVWADFNVAKVNGLAYLTWGTYSETNNNRFEIERSYDGINYTVIGSRAGRGTTSVVSLYNFTDPEATVGTVYYRIRQVDIDGISSYSAVRTLDFSASALATVYPNPSSDNFNLQSFVEEALVYTVYDVTGKVIATGTLSGSEVIGGSYAPGAYIVRIQSNTEVQSFKLIKQ